MALSDCMYCWDTPCTCETSPASKLSKIKELVSHPDINDFEWLREEVLKIIEGRV